LGGPLVTPPGHEAAPLDARRWIRFARGRAIFERRFEAGDGLGPRYNDVSCAACHALPTVGGDGGGHLLVTVAPSIEEVRDVRTRHAHTLPGHAAEPAPPPEARKRRTPPLYGLGLLDAIPAELIAANADPTDRDGDGVRGVTGERAGELSRFGWKAHELTLAFFSAGALLDEMGVTSCRHRSAEARHDDDSVADPELDDLAFDALMDYVALLAPPPRGPTSEAASRGEGVFAATGCASCHKPGLGPVAGAYTDLLLHRMGAALDEGLPDARADGDMWRTPPLWGLRHRVALQHDAAAPTVERAIARHGGEAEGARRRYDTLDPTARADLLTFLRSL